MARLPATSPARGGVARRSRQYPRASTLHGRHQKVTVPSFSPRTKVRSSKKATRRAVPGSPSSG